MTTAQKEVTEAAGVAAWLHEMAERSGISTEDHIKLRYAAALIVAREDLLAACRRARAGFAALIAANDLTDDEREQVAMLDAAIAKAEGH